MKSWLTGIFGLLLMVGLLSSCAPDHSTPPFAGPNQNPDPPSDDQPVGSPSEPSITGPGIYADISVIPRPDSAEAGDTIPDAIIKSFPGSFESQMPVWVSIASSPGSLDESFRLGIPGSFSDTWAREIPVFPDAEGVIEVGVYLDLKTLPGDYVIEAMQGATLVDLVITVE